MVVIEEDGLSLQSGCDRRERMVRSVLNGLSVLFYHNHYVLNGQSVLFYHYRFSESVIPDEHLIPASIKCSARPESGEKKLGKEASNKAELR